jgi:hypothetical protein
MPEPRAKQFSPGGASIPLIAKREDGTRGPEDPLTSLASGRDLAGIDLSLVGELGRERCLRDALEPVLSEYDHVVIDTPPNLGLVTVNALVLAELVIALASAEDEESLHGIRELRRTVRRLAERLDRPALQIVSIVTCWAPHRISSRAIEHALEWEGLAPPSGSPSARCCSPLRPPSACRSWSATRTARDGRSGTPAAASERS